MTNTEWETTTRKARHLYVVRDESETLLKIGRSYNPPGRLEDLQIAAGAKLELAHVEHDAASEEVQVHEAILQQEGFSAAGQWFRFEGAGDPLDAIRSAIKEVCRDVSRPPSDSFYTYGCRCDGCRGEHTAAVRRRRESGKATAVTDAKPSRTRPPEDTTPAAALPPAPVTDEQILDRLAGLARTGDGAILTTAFNYELCQDLGVDAAQFVSRLVNLKETGKLSTVMAQHGDRYVAAYKIGAVH